MAQLSDTQLIILNAAAQREDRIALPLPANLKGGAATRVVDTMIAKGLLEEVERALRPAMPEADPAALRRSARLLWTILHGITMLATAHKLSGVLTEPVQLMVDEFLTIYLRGLRQAADGADRE